MKTTFDTEAILFDLLLHSLLKNAINGGIYVGDTRPMGSDDEDIVVNTLALTADYLPQVAVSNVNIYVADTAKTIKGKRQLQANRTRLRALSAMALAVIRDAKIDGLKLIPESEHLLAEREIRQHFVNIRVAWNIVT